MPLGAAQSYCPTMMSHPHIVELLFAAFVVSLKNEIDLILLQLLMKQKGGIITTLV